jgi:predicted flap endonuclease-1-like 5' DNA nuclease
MFEQITKGPGSGTLTDHTLEIIIMLLVAFVLGYLLRYFLTIDRLKKLKKLTVEHEALQAEQEKCKTDIEGLKARIAQLEKAKPDKVDDLKIVEGIGPKIEQVLNQAGIWTFNQLAKLNEGALRKVLTDADPSYKIHNPASWPQQCSLAEQGKWDELKKLQDELLGGRKV